MKNNINKKITFSKLVGVVTPMLIYVGLTVLTEMILLIGNFILAFIIYKNVSYEDVVNSLMNNLLLVTLCAAALTIPFFLFMRYRDIEKDKICGIHKTYEHINILKYLLIIPFAFASMMAANYFVSILTEFMPDFMISSYDSSEKIIYGSSIMIQIMSAAVFAPIVEEFAFRGLIYNRLKHMCNYKVAAVISAFLFGVFHGNWIQAPYAFIIGLVAVFVYEKYKNISAPIILHMAANGLSVFAAYTVSKMDLPKTETAEVAGDNLGILITMTVVMGALALLFGKIIDLNVNRKEKEV